MKNILCPNCGVENFTEQYLAAKYQHHLLYELSIRYVTCWNCECLITLKYRYGKFVKVLK